MTEYGKGIPNVVFHAMGFISGVYNLLAYD
jgi:hypothetical protein